MILSVKNTVKKIQQLPVKLSGFFTLLHERPGYVINYIKPIVNKAFPKYKACLNQALRVKKPDKNTQPLPAKLSGFFTLLNISKSCFL